MSRRVVTRDSLSRANIRAKRREGHAMNTDQPSACVLHRALALTCVAALGFLSIADIGIAQQSASSLRVPQETVVPPDELEQVFWACDYVATVNGVHAATVGTCSAATEKLKDVKFGGDFLQLLEWWRANKPAEHARLDAAAAGAGGPAPTEEPVIPARNAVRGLLAWTPYT
jgi:hypothetical protein